MKDLTAPARHRYAQLLQTMLEGIDALAAGRAQTALRHVVERNQVDVTKQPACERRQLIRIFQRRVHALRFHSF